MKILVLNGPNLNLLGQREPEIYGAETLEDIMALLKEKAQALGVEVDFFQSNEEGALVTKIQECVGKYDGMIFDEGLRLDVLVEDLIICELKAVEEMNSVWEAQILSHLKLTGKRLGFLINFNVPLIKRGVQRIIL